MFDYKVLQDCKCCGFEAFADIRQEQHTSKAVEKDYKSAFNLMGCCIYI